MKDPWELQRFVEAQEPVIDQVLAELRAGRKTSHWMWFVFPQLRGLGYSPPAQRFGIGSLAEAAAFLAHPVLGPRLRDCTRLVLEVQNRSVHDIFGSPDDLKFRSCMTLFSLCQTEHGLFKEALQQYFAGEPDPRTLELLRLAGAQ